MNNKHQKTPEDIQAQVAAYTAEVVGDSDDVEYIFNNLGNIAIEELVEDPTLSGYTEFNPDDDIDTDEGEEIVEDNYESYIEYLRRIGGQRSESIQGRIKLLKSYKRFEPAVTELKNGLVNDKSRKEHDAYMGYGASSTVFSITQSGKNYAVRVPNGSDINPKIIDMHVAGAVLAEGVPHLEQIVAASYEDGVTVAEIMPGKELGKLTVDEISVITDEQLVDLLETLEIANVRGIEIDPKPSNYFYDPTEGFGIVDYRSSKVLKTSSDQSYGEIVGWMATTINNAGIYGQPFQLNKSVEDYSDDLRYMKANLEVINRFRTLVQSRLAPGQRETALQAIDMEIEVATEAVDRYSNPDWVRNRITEEMRWAEERMIYALKQKSNEGKIMKDISY